MANNIKYLVRATLSAEAHFIAKIEAVEVLKETAKSWLITAGPCRHTSYHPKERYRLFDTADEAREYLKIIAEKNIAELKLSVSAWLEVMGGAKVEGWGNA
ncbi:hypothetical protein [uncultured Pantoea sp.]|uniref:hypothetical protein n=1 Tax=uncultured Pantoea sp. TaxID=218084 RepID=UPI0025F3273F|nr:hypothetical protein [uncultured Pantoea sp.]